MVIFTALPTGAWSDENRIVVDESDYRGVDDEQPPFAPKDDVRIRANENFTEHYDCMDELGEGRFGKVYRCCEKATGLALAAKRIKIKRDADREKVEREVAIMIKLRHPRIAQIYDAFSTPENDIVLVMEIVEGGELFDRVVEESYILTELAVVMIVCQLCEAVGYIHSKNIVHLDIKPENIMCVSRTGNRIKLIDFGLAQFYDGTFKLLFMAGTPEFVAPEVIKFEPIDFHTDMWSIGVVTYILLSGISPFLGETLCDTYVAVEKGNWEFDEEAFEGISNAAKDFIAKLLILDQKQRMLPEECLNHQWIVGNRAKVANDLNFNRPNIEISKSREGLKSYLNNKRFRGAAWGLIFLIRFKQQLLMSYDRRKVRTAVAEVYNEVSTLVKVVDLESAKPEVSTTATAKVYKKEHETPKVSINIPLRVKENIIASKAELEAATKHLKEKKLSSQIPKKKPKSDIKNEDMVRKAVRKNRENESNERFSKSKKVNRDPATLCDGSEGYDKQQLSESVSGSRNEEVRKRIEPEGIPVKCNMLTTPAAKQPAMSLAEFREPGGKYLQALLSKSVQTSKDVSERISCVSQIGNNRIVQELNSFSEKGKASRPIKTFRDVKKQSSRKTPLTFTHDHDDNSVKLYRAPDEEKERAKNLIELHRRGSVDRKQVNAHEIVAIKHERSHKNTKLQEDGKKFPSQELEVIEQDTMKTREKDFEKRKTGTNVSIVEETAKQMERTGSEFVSGVASSEIKTIKKSKDATTAMETGSFVCNKTSTSQKQVDESTIRRKSVVNKKSAKTVNLTAPSQFQQLQQCVSEADHDNKFSCSTTGVYDATTHVRGQMRRKVKQQRSEAGKKPFNQKDVVAEKTADNSWGKKNWLKFDESRKDTPIGSSRFKEKQTKQVKRSISSVSIIDNVKNETTATYSKLFGKDPQKKCSTKQDLFDKEVCQNLFVWRKEKKVGLAQASDTRSTTKMLTPKEDNEKLVEIRCVNAKNASKGAVEKVVALRKTTISFGSVVTEARRKRTPSPVLAATIRSNHGITFKKPKTSANSWRATVKEVKVKKLRDKYESETVSQNTKKAQGLMNKIGATSMEQPLHKIQDRATNISLKNASSTGNGAQFDAVKRILSQENSLPKNPLTKMKSDINLTEHARLLQLDQSNTLYSRRKALDDAFILKNQTNQIRPDVTAASLKNRENFNFGWLKLQLENRVNKEKEHQMTCRPRPEFKIPSIYTGNAKKALNMWKTMEQKFISKT